LNGTSTTLTFLYKNRTLNRTFRDVKYIDQQSTGLYLSKKGLSAVAIHDDLVATLGAEAVSYPSLTPYLPEAIFASSKPPDPLPRPGH
jgi:hypothetical protein